CGESVNPGLVWTPFALGASRLDDALRVLPGQKPRLRLAERRRGDRDDPFLSCPQEKGERENKRRESWASAEFPGAISAESSPRSPRRRAFNDFRYLPAARTFFPSSHFASGRLAGDAHKS